MTFQRRFTLVLLALVVLCTGCNWRIRGSEGASRQARTNQVCEGNRTCLDALDQCRHEYEWIQNNEDLYEIEKPTCARRLMAALPQKKIPDKFRCEDGSFAATCTCPAGKVWVISNKLDEGFCGRPEFLRPVAAIDDKLTNLLLCSSCTPPWVPEQPVAQTILDQRRTVFALLSQNGADPDKIAAAINDWNRQQYPFFEQVLRVRETIKFLWREFYHRDIRFDLLAKDP